METLKWLYLSFDGRCTRFEFWLGCVVPSLILFAALEVSGLTWRSSPYIAGAVYAAMVWIDLSVCVKRWHDIGKSGAWVLVNGLPVFGWLIALVENGFSDGDVGHNAHGPDPRGRGRGD